MVRRYRVTARFYAANEARQSASSARFQCEEMCQCADPVEHANQKRREHMRALATQLWDVRRVQAESLIAKEIPQWRK